MTTEARIIRICAPAGDLFTAEAIAGIVGDEFPLKLEEKTFATGRCLAAALARGGREIHLTIEADQWPDGLTAVFEPDLTYVSATVDS